VFLVWRGFAGGLVGVSAWGGPATLADPEDPESSLLYTKLAPKPPCGSQMPLAREALSDAEAACVLEWIVGQ
jgi:hypothetical protein